MQSRYLVRGSEPAYAALRIVAGLTLGFIGFQKIFGVLSPFKAEFGTQMWYGGMIELIGGSMIALGLLTPWAAFLASGTMAVAYIQFHWKFDFGGKFFPSVNQGGLPLIFCFLFLYIACKGSGIWSVDGYGKHWMASRTKPK